jgi:hypothetical protein
MKRKRQAVSKFKTVNEVVDDGTDIDGNFIKDNSFYVQEQLVSVTFDSGSRYNFISKKDISDLKL